MINPHFPEPPPLGMLAGVLGRGLVFAAMAAFVVSCAAWLLQGREGKRSKLGSRFFWVGAVLTVLIMGVHIALLLTKQFQYQYVFDNTEADMPFAYRLSAAWAAQEGSFLLWAVMSAAIAAVAAVTAGAYRRWYTVVCAGVLIAMLGIISYESPFRLLALSDDLRAHLPAGQETYLPPTGRGLNPTLQNYWMTIHPWVIFIGFGSLLALFGRAVAAALSRDWQSWIQGVRPWAIFSMTTLGVGLTMGGLWAYETLGWGGFWAWDPVENVSLIPFVACIALVHGAYMQARRGRWTRLNLLLAALTFVWFVYGTYLTRSGALVNVSVHSFAKMNEGAHGLMLGLVVALAAGLVALTWVAFTRKLPEESTLTQPGDRSIGLAIGMALVYGIGIMAAIGMSLPFFAALFGGSRNVIEEGVYNKLAAYPFIPAMILMAVVPFLGWMKTRRQRWNHLANLFFVSVLLFGLVSLGLVMSGLTMDGAGRMPPASLAVFFALVWVCIFSIVANGAHTLEKVRARAGGFGPFVTHSGVALLLLGLIVSKAFEKTDHGAIALSAPAQLAAGPRRFLASLEALPTADEIVTPENRLQIALLDLSDGRRQLEARPVVYYNVPLDLGGRVQAVVRPHIERSALYDLYLAVGAPETDFATGINLKPNESKTERGVTVKYLEKTQSGKPGSPGARFGANLLVAYNGREARVNPEIELGPNMQVLSRGVPVGEDLVVELDALRAEDSSAVVSLRFPEPYFPVQLFFKPLTILVWIGAGMMSVGGILSIVGRR